MTERELAPILPVGPLSQGVPAIGTSWSHKYEMLFDEYDCPEMLLPVPADAKAVRDRIDAVVGESRAELAERVRTAGASLLDDTEAMWEEVRAALELDN